MTHRPGSHLLKALSALSALVATFAARAALAAPEVTLKVQGAGEGTDTGALIAFYIIGALTVIGAVATITRRNPVVAAVCLVFTLFASAGLYVLLHATFLAVIQVLVYAGAIMVLFVMVVMAVEHPEQEELGLLRTPVAKLIGVVAGGYLLIRLVGVLVAHTWPTLSPVPDTYGQVRTIGRLLFSDYLFPFEAISILLLVGIVGAVVVTRRRSADKLAAQTQATE